MQNIYLGTARAGNRYDRAPFGSLGNEPGETSLRRSGVVLLANGLDTIHERVDLGEVLLPPLVSEPADVTVGVRNIGSGSL